MFPRLLDHLYILATIFFTVFGQLILKWRIDQIGHLPANAWEKLKFLVILVFDPAVFSSFFAAFLASLAWMAAMAKFDLSYAYPFMSLNFVVVMVLSAWLLSEPITLQKALGVSLIVLGTVVSSRG